MNKFNTKDRVKIKAGYHNWSKLEGIYEIQRKSSGDNYRTMGYTATL